MITPARKFVYTVCCYNPAVSWGVRFDKKCKLFTAGKIRVMLREYMSAVSTEDAVSAVSTEDAKDAGDTENPPSAIDQTNRALLLLTIASRLPGYARVCGGLLIAAAGEYLSRDILETQLDYTADSQDHSLLWTEQFIRAGMMELDTREIDKIIESSAEMLAPDVEIEWIE